MEGDELSEFLVTKQHIKETLDSNEINCGEETVKDSGGVFNMKRQPLTTKNAMKFLLEGTLKFKVCRFCLNVDSSLYEMGQVFQIGGKAALYKVTIRDMVASFYPFQVVEDPNCPTKICEKCLDNAFQSYLFAQQCEQAGRALRNCFEDMYDKLDKLDPLERTKKRGRQKLNPNFNRLYTEHEKVIDYADPIINIVNNGSELMDKKDDKINDMECPRCWQVFTSLETLINHEKIHPKSMWFNCRLCGTSFSKRHLYRKHVKTAHDKPKEVAMPESSFKCFECNVGNETYDKHLQHMEKHKFQMVMEHLVERKMDELCTVCLTKDGDMVKLDRTVNFHGGCPELTGHRSLYNILGSTMPEQASYKYQELLVAHEAKTLTITKKQKFKLSGEQIALVNDGDYYYSLSDPIIISREILETEDYLFFFTKPIQFEQTINIDENDEGIQNENEIIYQSVTELLSLASDRSPAKNVEVNTDPSVKIYSEKTFLFSFSNPDYNIDVEKVIEISSNDKISESVAAKPCNIDWVFKKSDEDTITIQEDAINDCDESKVAVMKDCNYCWIFKNTDKCNNCQKPNNKYERSLTDDMKTNTNIETKTYVDTNKVQKNKRNNVELNDYGNKRLKWQCKFCLTINGDNEKCYCCDTEYHKDLDHHVKFNLGNNKSFFETVELKHNGLVQEEDTPDKAISDISSKISNQNGDGTLQDINIPNQIIGTENANTSKPEIIYNSKEDEDMDTEFITTIKPQPTINKPKIPCCNDTNFFQEEMEVEECIVSYDANKPPSREMHYDNNQMPSVQFPQGSMKITNVPLNFNIGTSDGRNTRRLKRPLRRMATSFHK